jgi:hypothetical protein
MAIETGTESIARRDGRGIRTGTGCGSSEDDEARALTAMLPPIDATTEAIGTVRVSRMWITAQLLLI